jgi:double zinc ribbon protein
MASSKSAPAAPQKCAACGAESVGKFCSNCGSPLAGAACASCGGALTPGAKFCHRCGAPAGAGAPAAAAAPPDQRSSSNALPWSVAAIALVALVALVAGQRFSRSSGDAASAAPTDAPAAPFAGGGGQPPDISNMSPAERAIRLYDRVMMAHERGRADSVQMFAPMAIAAYQQLDTLDADARYDLGRIAAVSGNEPLARAQADTILAAQPTHLLGLILAGNAARMRKDAAAERGFYDKLVAAAPKERARQIPEYSTHQNDITIALAAKRP